MSPSPGRSSTRRPASALALLLLAWPLAATARPGGGHSYSGSSSSSSSSSSGSNYSSRSSNDSSSSLSSWPNNSPSRSNYGSSSSSSSSSRRGCSGDDLFILGFLIAGLLYQFRAELRSFRSQRWDSHRRIAPAIALPRPRPVDPGDMIRDHDPDFSAVLFEDFVYALYARVHEARSDPAAMAALAPYISAESRDVMLRRDPAGVRIHGVVIGAMRVLQVVLTEGNTAKVQVEIEFEANYTASLEHGPQGYYIHERWKLERELGVRTRPPVEVLALGCPACGAPFRSTEQGRCAHCGKRVDGGRFDWSVTHVRAFNQEWRPPNLTSEVAEQGTDQPTIFDPGVTARLSEFLAVEPGVAAHIEDRVHAIFTAMNAGWTARDLGCVRPFVSDAQFNYLSYWIAAYKAQGLRNLLRDMSIARVELVKLRRDRHYDAITVRVFASGLDTTVRASDGRRVSGSDTYPRHYSEYWTLIRRAGVRGVRSDPATCPNCAAPLDRVNMAGNCEYCSAHLTCGEFDWVLSKIEQDEAYAG